MTEEQKEARSRPRFRLVLAGAILLSVLAVGFLGTRRVREGSYHPRCNNRLRQVALACLMYAEDNDELFPPDLDHLHLEYIDRREDVFCPAAGFRAGAKYALEPGLRRTFPNDCILTYCRTAGHHGGKGRNVAFVDAHVEWMRESEFQAALKKQRAELAKLNGAEE